MAAHAHSARNSEPTAAFISRSARRAIGIQTDQYGGDKAPHCRTVVNAQPPAYRRHHNDQRNKRQVLFKTRFVGAGVARIFATQGITRLSVRRAAPRAEVGVGYRPLTFGGEQHLRPLTPRIWRTAAFHFRRRRRSPCRDFPWRVPATV